MHHGSIAMPKMLYQHTFTHSFMFFLYTRQVRTGLYYNPYFPGGSIAMPKMLADGGAEYDDGTPASESQQAKDVTTFLTWSGYPFQVCVDCVRVCVC